MLLLLLSTIVLLALCRVNQGEAIFPKVNCRMFYRLDVIPDGQPCQNTCY